MFASLNTIYTVVGGFGPLFCCTNITPMISKETISQIIDEKIASDGVFVVELTVGADNRITLVVDKKEGVDIEYCVELSRLVESKLDRDVEDYELEVSSAGIGCELKVLGQFEKNLGNMVEVTYGNGSHKKGVLVSADAEAFEVDIEEKVLVEGAKKKQSVVNRYRYAYDEVKQVKDIISFK